MRSIRRASSVNQLKHSLDKKQKIFFFLCGNNKKNKTQIKKDGDLGIKGENGP